MSASSTVLRAFADPVASPRPSGLFPIGSARTSDPLAPLASRAVRGDAGAERALLDRLVPPLRRFLERALTSVGETDDALQESLVAVLGALPGYRGESSVVRFSIGVARRLALTRSRTSARYARRIARAAQLELPLVAGETSQSEGVAGGRLRTELLRLLGELPKEQARAFALRAIFDCSLGEIAAETGVSINTVRTRLRLAKKLLRLRIEGDERLGDLVIGAHDPTVSPAHAPRPTDFPGR